MNEILFSAGFKRAYKQYIRKHPGMSGRLAQTITQLGVDYTHISLRSHKLSGNLESKWSCSVAYDLRIVFRFQIDEATKKTRIILLTLGSHDDVY